MLRSILLLLVLTTAPRAQSLLVEAATPTDYAAGVALESAVSFTFSEALGDISAGGGQAPTLVTFPANGVEITSTDQSADGRTVSYSVELEPDQRYVFLVLNARSASGEALARPFALNFTTGSAGFLAVQGVVSDTDAGSLDGTLVALVTGDLAAGSVEIAAIDVIAADTPEAPYSVGPVGLGLYTAGAIRIPLDTTPEALGRLAYGFYDPNGDGTPDPIFGTSGIDIAVAPPEPATAADRYDDAFETASGAILDPELIGVPATLVDATGASGAWRYTFQSRVDQTKVDVVQVGLFGLPFESIDDAIYPGLETPFLDSDDALAVGDASGGRAFRDANEGRIVAVTMQAPADPFAVGEPEWSVDYSAQDDVSGPVVDALRVTVPFAFADESEGAAEALGAWLRHDGKHPTDGRLAVSVELRQSLSARLDVFDLRGRFLATLHEGPIPPGRTRFVSTHHLPSGVYVVRLMTPEASRVLQVVVAR